MLPYPMPKTNCSMMKKKYQNTSTIVDLIRNDLSQVATERDYQIHP